MKISSIFLMIIFSTANLYAANYIVCRNELRDQLTLRKYGEDSKNQAYMIAFSTMLSSGYLGEWTEDSDNLVFKIKSKKSDVLELRTANFQVRVTLPPNSLNAGVGSEFAVVHEIFYHGIDDDYVKNDLYCNVVE